MKLKAIYTALLFLVAWGARAQNMPLLKGLYTMEFESREGQQQFLNIKVPAGGGVKEFLPGWIKTNLLSGKIFNPQLLYTRQSPDGVYYTYGISYNDVVAYGIQIKLMVDNQSVLRYAYHNVPAAMQPAAAYSITNATIKGLSKEYAFFYNASVVLAAAPTWFFGGGKYIPAFVATIKDTARYEVFDMVFDGSGELLYSNALHSNSTGPGDTLAYAYVYNPDPLTTAHVAYGGAYSQNNGMDNPLLLAERRHKSFTARYNGREIVLENDGFIFSEISAPTWAPTMLKNRNTFNYSRSDHSFADVNAFYHLSTFENYIKSIGYGVLPGYKIQVDAHAFGGSDKSQFTSSDVPPSLQFGDGGIPDAEDADAVIHEFGHALSHGASPNTNIGLQRRAIDEGLGDYFAVSYSKSIDTFNWQKVFNWDGNNGGWQGRTADYTGNYASLTNNIWTDGQLWSTAFMRIYNSVGRETADKLMIEALFRLGSNTNMPQLAMAVMQIDSIKNGGINAVNINCAFASVGILKPIPGCSLYVGIKGTGEIKNFEVYNTQGFSYGGEAVLQFSRPGAYTLELTNALGQQIASYNTGTTDTYSLSGQDITPGIYFLRVKSEKGFEGVVKLLRY